MVKIMHQPHIYRLMAVLSILCSVWVTAYSWANPRNGSHISFPTRELALGWCDGDREILPSIRTEWIYFPSFLTVFLQCIALYAT